MQINKGNMVPENELIELDKKKTEKSDHTIPLNIPSYQDILNEAVKIFEPVTDKKYQYFKANLSCAAADGVPIETKLFNDTLKQVNIDNAQVIMTNKHAEKKQIGDMRGVLYRMMKMPALMDNPDKIAIS